MIEQHEKLVPQFSLFKSFKNDRDLRQLYLQLNKVIQNLQNQLKEGKSTRLTTQHNSQGNWNNNQRRIINNDSTTTDIKNES